MTKKKINRIIKTAYFYITAAFVVFIAVDDIFWTSGMKSGYDRAILLLFVYLMGIWVAGSKDKD